MCGIAGVTNLGDVAKNPDLSNLLVKLSERGRDATGIGYNRVGYWHTLKNGVPALKFTETKLAKKMLREAKQARTVLLHCRQATNGSAHNNANNHPVMSDKGMLVHNGVVYFSESFKGKGTVDSEQLLLAIEKYGLKKAIQKAGGTLTFAYVEYKHSNKLYLYHGGMPLTIVVDKDRVWFGSTLQILFNGVPHLGGKAYEAEDGELWTIDSHNRTIQKEKVQRRSSYVSYERGGYDWSNTNAFQGRFTPFSERFGRHTEDFEIIPDETPGTYSEADARARERQLLGLNVQEDDWSA